MCSWMSIAEEESKNCFWFLLHYFIVPLQRIWWKCDIRRLKNGEFVILKKSDKESFRGRMFLAVGLYTMNLDKPAYL